MTFQPLSHTAALQPLSHTVTFHTSFEAILALSGLPGTNVSSPTPPGLLGVGGSYCSDRISGSWGRSTLAPSGLPGADVKFTTLSGFPGVGGFLPLRQVFREPGSSTTGGQRILPRRWPTKLSGGMGCGEGRLSAYQLENLQLFIY